MRARSPLAPPPIIEALTQSEGVSLVGRVLLTLPYWWSALSKLGHLDAALAEAEHLGLEPAPLIVAATLIVQAFGSLAVITGKGAWLGAGALGVFTALATLIAHPFWSLADPLERFHALNTFLEHIGLIGGFMLAAALLTRPADRR
ncbi:MAG: DoxX family protein [Caulobacter sp.]|nr:DoxX family protein [Caulobacter sp.]